MPVEEPSNYSQQPRVKSRQPTLPTSPTLRRSFVVPHRRPDARSVDAQMRLKKDDGGETEGRRLALRFLRLVVAGGVANAWTKFGDLGATLADLARILELSVARNVEGLWVPGSL